MTQLLDELGGREWLEFLGCREVINLSNHELYFRLPDYTPCTIRAGVVVIRVTWGSEYGFSGGVFYSNGFADLIHNLKVVCGFDIDPFNTLGS